MEEDRDKADDSDDGLLAAPSSSSLNSHHDDDKEGENDRVMDEASSKYKGKRASSSR